MVVRVTERFRCRFSSCLSLSGNRGGKDSLRVDQIKPGTVVRRQRLLRCLKSLL